MRAAEQVQLAPLRHLFIWLVTEVSLVARKLIPAFCSAIPTRSIVVHSDANGRKAIVRLRCPVRHKTLDDQQRVVRLGRCSRPSSRRPVATSQKYLRTR
jgi:hypothetical protein